MKIVNRKQFLALPQGTLFAKYEPCCFEDLLIKGESLEPGNDFFYTEITSAIDTRSSEEFSDLLEQAETKSISLQMDFDGISRDGCFDNEQLFAVFEKQDVERLITKLKQSLVIGYHDSTMFHNKHIIAAETCPICHIKIRENDIHTHNIRV